MRRHGPIVPIITISFVLAALVLLASRAGAQGGTARLPAPLPRIELAGPRFGVTFLNLEARAKLADRGIEVGTVISQFGWQFERSFESGDAIAPVTEVVVLVGGLDQGVFLPSLTWIVGLRSAGGMEVGVGPNVTPAGFALAIAAGAVVRQRTLNIPITVAAVPSATGVRMSMLTGFMMR
jgi:hypothetical protein